MLSPIWTYVAFGLALLSLVVSYLAIQLALRRYMDTRDFRDMRLAITELEDMHEALKASHERLRSRFSMRQLREKRKSAQNGDDSDPVAREQEDAAEWKRRKRLELAQGKLKPR